jgi:UbiA prenyltransferase family
MTGVAPGPWLRLCALLASGGTLVAVISGSAQLGTTHRVLAALVAPPLCALVVAAWIAHRELVPSVLASAALFTIAAALPGRPEHITFAALALAALCAVTVQAFRGEREPWGSWRDYVTLTKPRIMSLLLITGFCGMIAGARGWPGTATGLSAMLGLALACGGASALNHVLDRDIDPLMGERTKRRPVASGRVSPSRALEFGLALSALSFVLLASMVNVLTAVLALAQALDAAEHRHRRRGRGRAAARRLGCGDRQRHARGVGALRDRLRLDAAALLGARAADQGQLQERRRADAARRPG